MTVVAIKQPMQSAVLLDAGEKNLRLLDQLLIGVFRESPCKFRGRRNVKVGDQVWVIVARIAKVQFIGCRAIQ